MSYTTATPTKYFNSRPSARGDELLRHAVAFVDISIHAPPRGATCRRCLFHGRGKFQFTPLREGRPEGFFQRTTNLCISIHAPPRGATALPRRTSNRLPNFNSRPSARGDESGEWVFTIKTISIHAPPRGATMRRIRAVCLPFNFNSRPSARGDFDYAAINKRLTQFQFTPLREGRQLGLPTVPCIRFISIHAPPRGAT